MSCVMSVMCIVFFFCIFFLKWLPISRKIMFFMDGPKPILSLISSYGILIFWDYWGNYHNLFLLSLSFWSWAMLCVSEPCKCSWSGLVSAKLLSTSAHWSLRCWMFQSTSPSKCNYSIMWRTDTSSETFQMYIPLSHKIKWIYCGGYVTCNKLLQQT